MGGIAQVISGRSELVDYNGTTLTRVNITSSEGFVLGPQGEFLGTFRTVNGVKEESLGQFNVHGGKSKLINGTVRQVHPNGEVSYIEVRDGKAYRLVLNVTAAESSKATVKVVPCPGSETGCIEFDLKEGKSAEALWSWEVVQNYDGELNIDGFDLVDGLFFINGEVLFDVSNYYGRSIGVEVPGETGEGIPVDAHSLTYPGQIDYLLLNGIRGETVVEGVPPAYFDPNLEYSFVGSLSSEPGVTKSKIDYVALFEDKKIVGLDNSATNFIDMMVDALWDVARSRHIQQKEVRDVINKLNAIHNGQTTDFVPLAYSGGGLTLVKALNDRGNIYDQIKTVILVGAPINLPSLVWPPVYISPAKITNPNVNRVINVYGDQDPLRFMFSNDLGPNTTNIVLEGVGHTDYFYTPELYNELEGLKTQYDKLAVLTDDWSKAKRASLEDKIEKLEQRIEKVLYADAFLAALTAASSNDLRWREFYDDLPDPINGVHTLDAKDFAGNLNQLLQNKGIAYEDF